MQHSDLDVCRLDSWNRLWQNKPIQILEYLLEKLMIEFLRKFVNREVFYDEPCVELSIDIAVRTNFHQSLEEYLEISDLWEKL